MSLCDSDRAVLAAIVSAGRPLSSREVRAAVSSKLAPRSVHESRERLARLGLVVKGALPGVAARMAACWSATEAGRIESGVASKPVQAQATSYCEPEPVAKFVPISHAVLVQRAVRWLRGTMKCGVVFAERSCGGAPHEIPDAIGWRVGFWSILVECKTSRADFFRDAEKVFRVDPSLGMGQARYYMTPAGLLRREEVPGDWGLVEVHGDRVKVVVEAPKAPLRESACRWELAMLVGAMRRVQLGCEPTEKVATGDGVAGE